MSQMGAQTERALARAFDRDGWTVMRSPASGAATTRDQPDLLVGKFRRTPLAMELKFSGKPRIYVSKEKAEALCRVAVAFGAYPIVGARFKGERKVYAWRVNPNNTADGWRPNMADTLVLDNGKHRVHKDDREEALVLAEFDTDADEWVVAI